MNCLVGYTGFVGSNLNAQRKYDFLVNSKNFHDMEHKHFDRIVCAGVSAVKWKANKEPEEDLKKINELIDVLKTVEADKFVLISTIDVYVPHYGADEDYDCHQDANQPYGKHRLMFEDFCRKNFKDCLVVRLPALFGKGLKKNVIFDLMNDNCLDMINPNSSFQYYCLDDLSDDIEKAESNDLKTINLFTEPIKTQILIDEFFKGKEVGANAQPQMLYNNWTKYASIRTEYSNYMYSKDEIMKKLKNFIEENKAK